MTECARCGKKTDKTYPAFGKQICQECKDNRPNKGTGNSGMSELPQIAMTFGNELYLERVSKSNVVFGRLFFHHYPESKGIVGRTFCYLIHYKEKVAGIIGFASPPRNYKKFRKFFDVEDDNLFMNNNVFRIIRSEKNLGTRILKLARKQVQQNHIERFKHEIIGLVTFVEPPRTGALYKADNWKYLGKTQGISMSRDEETWERVYKKDIKKHIFAYKY